jgi:hypothetical protein
MASTVYDALANEWLAILQETTCYASLHYEVPSTDNPLASEADSPSYTRSMFLWTPGGTRTLSNLEGLQWLNLEDITIIGVGAMNAPVGGQLLLFFQLDDPIPINGRGSWSLGAGELFVRV